jgi:hypothetical protein
VFGTTLGDKIGEVLPQRPVGRCTMLVKIFFLTIPVNPTQKIRVILSDDDLP